ncbi:hypothetical protein RJ55_01050 [Drechmeria coniospora]|nr:hypothetical protein RJ55_01050 [Drechmeria coniospora]
MTSNLPTTSTESALPNPPRRSSETEKNSMMLKEAFPTVDVAIIKAVIRASGGKVEPAFNALLEMTDPDAVKDEPEDTPPPQPRRPQGHTPMTQVEADELYARQLAEHYDNVGAYEARTSSRSRYASQPRRRSDDDEREHSFLDDDLPVIRENLRKGFVETQSKVNGWITNLRKKIEENFDESEEPVQGQGQPFRRQPEPSRRSGDYERYDADPQVLTDDFAGMKFSADGTPVKRPVNPSLHRPPPLSSSPRPADGRRVGFKEETEEINMYETSPKMAPKSPPPSVKPSKWQPLSAVPPTPIIDHDPFSLGDSDDEKETKDSKEKEKETEKAKDSKPDVDEDKLKKAAAEAMSDTIVSPAKGESSFAAKS